MVEFCIGAPILLLLFFGIVELGEMLSQASTLAESARSAARYLATNALLGSTGTVSLTGPLVTTAQNIAVFGNPGGFGAPLLPDFSAAEVTITTDGANNIAVSIAYPYESLIGGAVPLFFEPGSIVTGGQTLTAYASMLSQ